MRWRVVCALFDVMLIFWPTSAFSSVDLPTLGRPTMATRPQRFFCPCSSTEAASIAAIASGLSGVSTYSWPSSAKSSCRSSSSGCSPDASWGGLCSGTGMSFAGRHVELAGLDSIEQLLRRRLLGGAARAADAGGAPLQLGDVALDLEGLRVGLAAGGGDAVGRHRHVPRLQPFLQFRLGVLAPAVDAGRHDGLAEQPLHQRLGGLEAAVDADRADQRLDRIGQDGRPRGAAA